MITKTELRYEKLETSYEIPYYWDESLGVWLSCSQTIVSCGKTGISTGFLRVDNGADMTATHGFEIPYAAKLVWLSANARSDDPPGPTCGLLIHSNGSVVRDGAWTIAPYRTTLDVDIAVGSLSVSLPTLMEPDDRPRAPNVHLGLRWKLP